MEILQKLKKEPRPLISILLLIFFFLPWLSDATNVSMDFGEFGSFDSGYIEGGLYSGFDLFGVTYSSLILPFLPLLLLAVEFLSVLRKYKKVIYPVASILGIIASVVIIMVTSGIITAGNSESYDSQVSYQIGFYITIIAYVILLIVTIIIDFKINNKTLKEQGLKGTIGNITGQVVHTVGEMKENIQSGELQSAMKEQISSIGNGTAQKTNQATIECPACKATVLAGKKFCNKCGYKFEIKDVPVIIEPVAPEYMNQEVKPEIKNNAENRSNIENRGNIDNLNSMGNRNNVDDRNNVNNKNNNHMGETIMTVPTFKCEYCGEEIPQGKKYCPECGKKVEGDRVCTNCGATIPKGKKFCADCGSPTAEPKKDIICVNCGAKVTEGKKFCSECGTPTEHAKRICKNCGAELEEGKRFCFECGTEYIR